MADGAALLDLLDLADWRRRVATLYADVRRLAAADPAAAHAHWRATREHLYRTHPQSPVPAPGRAGFRARHFPYSPVWRFVATVHFDVGAAYSLSSSPTSGEGESPPAGRLPSFPSPLEGEGSGVRGLALPVSTGGTMAFHRIGWVDVPFPGGTRRLAVYWLEGYAGGLFLPFRDATNGAETYGAGRYLLDAAKGADLGGPFEDAGGGPGGDAAGGAGWPTDSNEPTRRALVLDFNFAYHPSCAFDPRWACPLAPPENRLDLAVRAGERIA